MLSSSAAVAINGGHARAGAIGKRGSVLAWFGAQQNMRSRRWIIAAPDIDQSAIVAKVPPTYLDPQILAR